MPVTWCAASLPTHHTSTPHTHAFRAQVMWHPDIIHGVEEEDSAQQHPSNVVYTATLPMCPLNARYNPHFPFIQLQIFPQASPFSRTHSSSRSPPHALHLSIPHPPLFSYIARQRVAFLDGVRPPDFCEGANEKTCGDPLPPHHLSSATSNGMQVHRDCSSTAQNHAQGSVLCWPPHDVRLLV